MWGRGHVLGGRVTAATRLSFPYFAMRWGFARPRGEGDRRDLTTGMSGGAAVGLPRLGLSGNGKQAGVGIFAGFIPLRRGASTSWATRAKAQNAASGRRRVGSYWACLLYTSDAADE